MTTDINQTVCLTCDTNYQGPPRVECLSAGHDLIVGHSRLPAGVLAGKTAEWVAGALQSEGGLLLVHPGPCQ